MIAVQASSGRAVSLMGMGDEAGGRSSVARLGGMNPASASPSRS